MEKENTPKKNSGDIKGKLTGGIGCSKCGHYFQGHSNHYGKFCSHCGTFISSPETEVRERETLKRLEIQRNLFRNILRKSIRQQLGEQRMPISSRKASIEFEFESETIPDYRLVVRFHHTEEFGETISLRATDAPENLEGSWLDLPAALFTETIDLLRQEGVIDGRAVAGVPGAAITHQAIPVQTPAPGASQFPAIAPAPQAGGVPTALGGRLPSPQIQKRSDLTDENQAVLPPLQSLTSAQATTEVPSAVEGQEEDIVSRPVKRSGDEDLLPPSDEEKSIKKI